MKHHKKQADTQTLPFPQSLTTMRADGFLPNPCTGAPWQLFRLESWSAHHFQPKKLRTALDISSFPGLL